MKHPKLYSQNSSQFSVKIFWVWIINALLHSVLLFWIPMLAVQKDVIWLHAKEGGYLVLGNMVYTVRLERAHLCVYGTYKCGGLREFIQWRKIVVFFVFFCVVCCVGCLLKSWTSYVFVDHTNPFLYLGICYELVCGGRYLQVSMGHVKY